MRTYMWKLIDAITFDASKDGILDVYDCLYLTAEIMLCDISLSL